MEILENKLREIKTKITDPFYWIHEREILIRTHRTETGYEHKIISVRGTGKFVPYKFYQKAVISAEENIEKEFEKNPNLDYTETQATLSGKVFDPLYIFRLLNKLSILKIEQIK